MILLALETATEACSAALRLPDGRIVSRYEHAPRQQAKLLLPMVAELLSETGLSRRDITTIAYSRGPGAFTGVRIAAAAAQGLAFGLGVPVIPVSSLQAVAQHAWRTGGESRVLTVFDARMDEIYVGAHVLEDGVMTPVIPETLCHPSALPRLPDGDWFLAGNGAVYREVLAGQVALSGENADLHPHAHDLAALAAAEAARGGGVPPENALPVYLRDEVWQKLPGR